MIFNRTNKIIINSEQCDLDIYNIRVYNKALTFNEITQNYIASKKDNIILSVRNRGQSISKEDREKIFERFYRVDKSRNRNENRYGLGLAIAKNISEIHRGKISVNCANGYTTFMVNFKK